LSVGDNIPITKSAQSRRSPRRRSARPSLGLRNREETRKRILAAVARLLARRGSRSLGINAIAREAQVDKVLIYRYFGGLGELYRAFAREGDTFPGLEEMAGGGMSGLANLPPHEAAKTILLGFGRAIRRRPLTREMMRWELQERNEFTDALAKEREQQSQRWFGLAPKLDSGDFPAVASILAAAQVYLVLRSKTAAVYNGIDLHSVTGWKRIEDAVALLSDLFFQHAAKGRPDGVSASESQF